MARLYIGISGWRYAPWRKVFYPEDLPQRKELHFASRKFPSIELNGSFYSLQRPESYAQWQADTPPSFVFSIKGSRYITHVKRLRDIRTPLANFYASGLLNLGKKLGPFLWQFPPNFKFDEILMENFFALLPRDTDQALSLARKRESFMKGRGRLAVSHPQKLRHAVEVRHDSFRDERFIRLLRLHHIALVVADTAGKWPFLEDVTADFLYLRLHGDQELYASGYSDAALEQWAARIKAWHRGSELPTSEKISELKPPSRKSRDVYCYFDNDIKVKAPFDALNLMEKLGV